MILAIFGDIRVFDMTSIMTSLCRHKRYVCTFYGTSELRRVIAIKQVHIPFLINIFHKNISAPLSRTPFNPKRTFLLS